MNMHRLKTRQRILWQKLMQFTREGKLKDPIVPVPFGHPTQFALYLSGEDSFKFKYISDLDALCDAGFMTFRWNRQGTGKLYSLVKAPETAASHNALSPQKPLGLDLSPGELIIAMSGGRLPAEEHDHQSDVNDIAQRPLLRHTYVEDLSQKMLQAVRYEIPADSFLRFEEAVLALKTELLRSRPDALVIKQRISTVQTFFDDRPDGLVLAPLIWSHLYPLQLIGLARICQQTAKQNGLLH